MLLRYKLLAIGLQLLAKKTRNGFLLPITIGIGMTPSSNPFCILPKFIGNAQATPNTKHPSTTLRVQETRNHKLKTRNRFTLSKKSLYKAQWLLPQFLTPSIYPGILLQPLPYFLTFCTLGRNDAFHRKNVWAILQYC